MTELNVTTLITGQSVINSHDFRDVFQLGVDWDLQIDS